MDEDTDRVIVTVESVLVECLVDIPVGTVAAVDGDGMYLTEESAREIAELISTDIIDALVAEFYILKKPAEEQ